jgi:nucleoside-diphosphate-sugar epimerase
MRVLLTGATGFIGSAVASSLTEDGYRLRCLVRKKSGKFDDLVEQVVCDLDNLNGVSSEAFSNIDCVIHLAARTNEIKKNSLVDLNEYRRSNCDSTLNLANIASKHGVKRFIFLSSIKVNGEQTLPGVSFKADDNVATKESYGVSKYEAEKGLLQLALSSQMEIVIIRPPLVYGPNVKGNFASIISWIKKGVPLPFGAIENKRSFIALDNLVDFILLCVDRKGSPKAANQVFLLSDGEDVSTSILLRRIAKAYGLSPRLFPMPVSLMRFFATLLARKHLSDRLFGNLQVDSSKARDLLGWEPVYTMEEQLRRMAEIDQSEIKL